MILPDLDLKPVLIPHHKGRKRLHLGTTLTECSLFASVQVTGPLLSRFILICNKARSTVKVCHKLILNADTVPRLPKSLNWVVV